MATMFDALTEDLKAFIIQQHIFFVATAPEIGRINLSPKGMDSFKVLGDKRVAYLSVTGSGNETAAHLSQNGRLTIMFCSFDKRPLILRLYGHGRAIHRRDAEWEEMIDLFEPIPGVRQIINMDVAYAQTSCGFAVPFYDYQGERDALKKWAINRGDDGIEAFWEDHNQQTIDGLPTHLLDRK
jgi:hypothetical protein